MKRVLIAAALFLFDVSTASALPIITAGNHPLLPNTPGQRVEVYVSGGDLLQGMNVFAEIGNSAFPPGTVQSAPKFTNLAYDGIFAGGIPSAITYTPNRQFLSSSVVTVGSPPDINGIITPTYVPASGLLFSVTVDTTGYFSGTYDFTLANTTLHTSTQLIQNDVIPSVINNGTLSIVPEPHSLAIFAAGLVGACILLCGSQRKRTAARS